MILSNAAGCPLVTLDANIVIALRNNGRAAIPAQQLLAFNRVGMITVNVTLSTALEEQRPDYRLDMRAYAAKL